MNEPGSIEGKARRIRRVEELPREIAPARDLWPGIAAQIEAERAATASSPVVRRGAGLRWVGGLAASVALVAVGVWLGRMTQPDVTVADASAPAALQLAAFAPGADYEAARRAELARLPARLAALPPQSREQVRASLETLQRSIREIQAALGNEPANALLQSMLIDTYHEEMRVLTTLNAAASAGEEI